MGCVSSHPCLPPSPMPHTTSGPPPRPILTARAHTFYDIQEHGTPLLSRAPPTTKSQKNKRDQHDRKRAATWEIAPHSKLVSRERSPPAAAPGGGMVQQRSRTFGGVTTGTKGGYVGLEGERRERRKDGSEWHNRMKVGKEGEVWFF